MSTNGLHPFNNCIITFFFSFSCYSVLLNSVTFIKRSIASKPIKCTQLLLCQSLNYSAETETLELKVMNVSPSMCVCASGKWRPFGSKKLRCLQKGNVEKKRNAKATEWCQELTSWMWNLDGKRQNRMSDRPLYLPLKREKQQWLTQ